MKSRDKGPQNKCVIRDLAPKKSQRHEWRSAERLYESYLAKTTLPAGVEDRDWT